MKILVGCEESQAVTIAFRNKGHEAYSCDIQPCSGGHPEWHIQGDVLKIIQGGFFNTENGDLHEVWQWDMGIFFPPCTFLSYAGNRVYNAPGRAEQRQQAIEFFKKLYNCNIPKVAVENPRGWIINEFRKFDQEVYPYYFGDPEVKRTCLWLRNLPKLLYSKTDTLFF